MTLLQEPSTNGAHSFTPAPPPATFTSPEVWIDPDPSKGWIRRLLPVLRPHRKVLIGMFLASIVMLGMQLSIPQVVRGATDNALLARTASLTPYVVALVVLGFGQLVFGYAQRFGMQRASVELECTLRSLLFTHLSKQSFAFYDAVQSGQLISRANSDIRAIQMMLAFGPMIAVSGLTFVAALVLMVQMDPVLTAISVVTLPFVFFTGLNMRKRLFPIAWVMMARTADLATIVEENVTGTRVVKSFAAEKGQLSLFDRSARRLRWASIQQVNNQARYGPLMQSIPQLSLVIILLVGGYQVIHGNMSLGTFIVFNTYVVMLQVPFVMIGMIMMMGQRAKAAAQRVLEVLDTEPDMVDAPGAVDIVDCEGDVEFRDVDFAYFTGNPVLQHFSLHLRPGETVALVGRTGSGKSTVSRLIPRFYDVTNGVLLVDGQDVRGLTIASLRSHIGMVTDEPFLFSESIRDNIAFGRPDASFDEVEAAAIAAGAHDFILELSDGYDTVIGERGYTLSGGQRQRIAIARTLLVNPRILMLDDATSAVDAQREFEIHGALRTLMRGRTTLIIAHRLSTISLADRVVVLEGGRIVADGRHDELMRDVPLYREILAHAEEDLEREHEYEMEEEEEAAREQRIEELTHSSIDGNGSGASPPAPELPEIPGGIA
ncbi:MAG TPA: ABC transporter ATP-binding protein [Acidimicrobiia bacterium]|nr:ABC transporter ATP-binding protein [Acidimicrobiia bacterium]